MNVVAIRMKSEAKISVVICTHNPKLTSMRQVLQGLSRQTLALERWELVIIDNASDLVDLTAFDLTWHPDHRLIREDKLGLAYARVAGIRTARGSVIVFVDDDNVLNEDYLEKAWELADQWPKLGVWGGSISPEFEAEPDPSILPFLSMLAIRRVASPCWSNLPAAEASEPWGAGLCLRSDVADAYIRNFSESQIKITGRRGGALISGEDTEISRVACGLGYGMGVFPQLKLTHLIPATRLKKPYLIKLREGLDTSSMLLAYKFDGKAPSSPFRPGNIWRIAQAFTRSRFEGQLALASVRAYFRVREIIQ